MKAYRLPEKQNFEKMINEKKSHLIILKNRRGMEVALSDYGARVVSILVPDKNGKPVDVVLGFNTIDDYLQAVENYYGVTVGRYANRIANGRFTLLGKEYYIKPNNGPNALHGGEESFNKRVWDRRVNNFEKAEFYLVSPDGDNGFPGNLTISVAYSITEKNELIIQYRAETDAPTVLSLTNHTFFNLNGEGEEGINNHEFLVNADSYLPVNEFQIPLGEFKKVEGTAFDFRKLKPVNDVLLSADSQIKSAKGIDHNYVLNTDFSTSNVATKVLSPRTGIQLEVFTTEPGMQLYTGNSLSGRDIGKQGKPYEQYGAFCLETQKFPDSPNQASFPSCVLQPGEVFTSESRYRFSVKK